MSESLTDDASAAAQAAADADTAVVVVGCTWRDEGEYLRTYGGDRKSLRLSPEHERLIEATAAACPHTVVVLVGGSAFITESWRNQVQAILMTWYSGDEGGTAIAQVLLGSEAPGGRLPNTWPMSEAQLPTYRRWTRTITYGPLHGYRLFHANARRPAFWFGEGLSYTNFTWTDAMLTAAGDPDGQSPGAADDAIGVAVTVANVGDRAGAEVVQVYVNVALGTCPTPLPTLAGFARTNLDAGALAQVTVELDSDLADRARQQQTEGIEDAGLVWVGPNADPQQLVECGRLD